MIVIGVPGWCERRHSSLVLDVNGTLSLDGELVAGVEGRLQALRAKLDVDLLSVDTFGRLDGSAASLGPRPAQLAVYDRHGDVRFQREPKSDGQEAWRRGLQLFGAAVTARLDQAGQAAPV